MARSRTPKRRSYRSKRSKIVERSRVRRSRVKRSRVKRSRVKRSRVKRSRVRRSRQSLRGGGGFPPSGCNKTPRDKCKVLEKEGKCQWTEKSTCILSVSAKEEFEATHGQKKTGVTKKGEDVEEVEYGERGKQYDEKRESAKNTIQAIIDAQRKKKGSPQKKKAESAITNIMNAQKRSSQEKAIWKSSEKSPAKKSKKEIIAEIVKLTKSLEQSS